MVNTILKEADLFCPNSVRINFTIYLIHTDSSVIEFSAKMIDIEKQLPQFYKAHKSILVNPDKVVKLDKQSRRIEFDNGDYCDIAYRKVFGLMNLIKNNQQTF